MYSFQLLFNVIKTITMGVENALPCSCNCSFYYIFEFHIRLTSLFDV